MTNLKDNIWIEGFEEEFFQIQLLQVVGIEYDKEVIYHGKTSEIPEEVAKKCVLNWRTDGLYNNYKIESQYEEYMFKTATESIQSACDKPYCIIYKK